MNKKGFTLVELLAVIVLLGVVATLGVASITGIVRVIQNNILNEKIAIIEEAAILKGQDERGSVINSTLKYKGYSCKSYIVSELVPTYLSKDNDNTCLGRESTGTNGCVVNPNDTSIALDKKEVIVYYRNKRIHAVYDKDNNLTCS